MTFTYCPGIAHASCEMPRITEKLVRRRAEHNNGEIATLEELSLHQQELERIEHLDRWCCHLKILYLQNNLIPCIENVGRLKELQYLNLALNNVEKIENLEGCEFLQKLDFTVNFIGDLLSVESLRCNHHLQELYLTGNPCTDYVGYREFVIATLPQLVTLDGKDITKSERISATQQLKNLRKQILDQQKEHTLKREKEKEAFREKHSGAKGKKPGYDRRWYTHPQAHVHSEKEEEMEEEKETEEELEEAYTPEYRLKSHRDMAKKKMEQAKEPDNKLEMPKRVRTLEKNGKMLNVNEGKYDFHLKDEGSHYMLEVKCPKYMDTSLIDCDVQTTYIRLIIKSKILQLVLEDEVSPDSSSAKRSQTTGHLLLTLPKAHPILQAPLLTTNNSPPKELQQKGGRDMVNKQSDQDMKYNQHTHTSNDKKQDIMTAANESSKKLNESTVFEDDLSVPPLI